MTKIKSILILCLTMFLFVACHKEDSSLPVPPPSTKSESTVLVYVMGENSLSPYVESDVQEMLNGSTSITSSNTNLLIFIDNSSQELPALYRIKDGKKTLLRKFNTDICTTDTAVLHEVLRWTEEFAPAKQYGLVMWSHGNGWLQDNTRTRSIGIDNQNNSYSNTGKKMEIEELEATLAEWNHLKFIFFDACFMQCAEVAYALRHVTDYTMGSPAEIPAEGAPYDKLAPLMMQNLDNVQEMMGVYFSAYANNDGVELSVIDCRQMEQLAQATSICLDSIRMQKGAPNLAEVQYYHNRPTQQAPAYYDLRSFIYHNVSETLFQEWDKAWKMAVPYSPHSAHWVSIYASGYMAYMKDMEHYGGITTYVPRLAETNAPLNIAFANTEWCQAAGWNKWNF